MRDVLFTPWRGRLVSRGVVALAAVLALVGCNRHGEDSMAAVELPAPTAPVAPAAPMADAAPAMKRSAEAAGAPAQATQRFVAVRQALRVEVPAEQLAEVWGKVRDLCGQLKCELLSSSLLRETPQQPGHAMLEMRVEPADVPALLSGVAGAASVVSHTTTSEDKTAEVIDVEARIKNRTEFRDGLRTMLSDTVTKRTMGELLEIQRTLSDTQAELDAMATQRKVLGQQTSREHIQIQFTAKRPLVSSGNGYNPLRNSLRNAGVVLAESLGSLVTFVAAALPWLLLLVLPLGWLLRLLWRRRRRRLS